MTELDRGASTVDFANCDREPIHTPGAILPHGALLVLDRGTLQVLQAAGDTQRLLGIALHELPGSALGALLSAKQIDCLRELDAALELNTPRHLLDPLLRVRDDYPLDASLYRSGEVLILEFEAADPGDRYRPDPLAAVQRMIAQLDQGGSLSAMCQVAAERVREVVQYDRVMVYQFIPDGSGWVVAESREAHLPPFLDLHYPAADIPAQARALYLRSWLRLITQVNYEPAPLVPPNNPRTGLPLDMSHAILRDVSPVHREYLRNMGVDASMSISIIHRGALWGLIACHHYSPRVLPRHLRAVCELFGSMFSLQIEAREKELQFEMRLASRTVLQNLMLNLASAEDYALGLTQQSPNLLDYIHSGDGGMAGERSGGVAVCVGNHLTILGTTPTAAQILSLVEWLNDHLDRTQGVFSTDRLGELWAPAQAFARVGSGLLVIAVTARLSDYIIWFRPELVASVRWAGRPDKVLEASSFGLRLSPRKSFDAWMQTVVGRCVPWTLADTEAARDLRSSLLHVVLRRLNEAAVERRRVAERDKLLMAELDHRVKNTLANIQALVVQTSHSAESLTGFVQGLDGRLQSMAKAHSLLSQSRWEGVAVSTLMLEELDHYRSANNTVVLSGPSLVLTPKAALALSLAVHELATNALKFGALSRAGGRIGVTWMLSSAGHLNLSWSESGGPTVSPPLRRGFGTTLIERALGMETGGGAILRYLPEGVVCDVFLPAGALASRTETQAPVPPADTAPAPVPAAYPPVRYRILVVEDSFLLVSLLDKMFDRLGWQAIGPATDLAGALELAAEARFDVAMLDVNLNGEMIWPVADLLRERGIPFIFCTGYALRKLLPAHLAGSVVLSKPFQLTEVEQRIRQVIHEHQAPT